MAAVNSAINVAAKKWDSGNVLTELRIDKGDTFGMVGNFGPILSRVQSMRGIALIFQMWLVRRIGAVGVGLYGLVGSVGFLAATVAISGIRFASTRLISEELGLQREGGVGRAMRLCFGYSLFFGLASAAVLYFCAEPLGFLWIGDGRTVLSLRILSLSLPFISLSSVIYGYFTASGRNYKAATVQIIEQLIRIGLVMLFLGVAPSGRLETCCAAVTGGSSAAEVCSFSLMLTLFFFDRRKYGKRGEASPRLPARMLSIAVPLALSAYARSSLSTLEQLLVPHGLKKAGLSSNSALAGYGTIQGMGSARLYLERVAERLFNEPPVCRNGNNKGIVDNE